MVNGEPAGAFNLFFDHPHEVSAPDAEFLATMAQLCGQALERALLAEAESRARERAEETARYATSLYSLGMRLASALTPLDVAATVMREAIEQHGAAAAAVGLIDQERGEVELLAEDGYPPGGPRGPAAVQSRRADSRGRGGPHLDARPGRDAGRAPAALPAAPEGAR